MRKFFARILILAVVISLTTVATVAVIGGMVGQTIAARDAVSREIATAPTRVVVQPELTREQLIEQYNAAVESMRAEAATTQPAGPLPTAQSAAAMYLEASGGYAECDKSFNLFFDSAAERQGIPPSIRSHVKAEMLKRIPAYKAGLAGVVAEFFTAEELIDMVDLCNGRPLPTTRQAELEAKVKATLPAMTRRTVETGLAWGEKTAREIAAADAIAAAAR